MRGYYVRKKLIPKKRIDTKIIETYTDKLIKNYIEVKIFMRLIKKKISLNTFL